MRAEAMPKVSGQNSVIRGDESRFLIIPLRPENPKIGGVYNAEVVGDRIAEDGPVFRHLLPQEMQNGSAEVIVGRMGTVVGHVSMHQSPQALDRIEVRAVARNVMQLDPAPRSRQPSLN